MNRHFLKSTKLFEKIEIEWFCEDDLKKRMSEYRPFYREVIATLMQKMKEIRGFIEKKQKKTRIMSRKNKTKSNTLKKVRKIKGG